jgi:hypothetical protein
MGVKAAGGACANKLSLERLGCKIHERRADLTLDDVTRLNQ